MSLLASIKYCLFLFYRQVKSYDFISTPQDYDCQMKGGEISPCFSEIFSHVLQRKPSGDEDEISQVQAFSCVYVGFATKVIMCRWQKLNFMYFPFHMLHKKQSTDQEM